MFDFIKNIGTLKFMTGIRTYTGLAALWLGNISEWAGFDVVGFDPMAPADLLMTTMIVLGIYEKVKTNT